LNTAEFIALVLVLLFIAIPIYELYQSAQELNVTSTTTSKPSYMRELAFFNLVKSPVSKYETIKFGNGTVIVIREKNPFKFQLNFPETVSMPFVIPPKKLPVYKATAFNTTKELIMKLEPLKFNESNFIFNNKTRQIIYKNSTLLFVYNEHDGRFLLKFEKPVKVDPVLYTQEIGLISWDFYVLKSTNQTSLIRLFHGILSTVWINIKS
jgi:hypothetical protein